ncbi:MAG TPA: glycosyltransferase [Pyrinomonadaceae bacterium]|nr:glycosyltransferase [Pyrinomonadaceae bacterium]
MTVLLADTEFETAPANAVAEFPFARANNLQRAQKTAPLKSAPKSERALKILWIADVDYRLGAAHGGNLRLISFARQVRAQGHEVYFAVPKRKADDDAEKQKFLERLKAQGVITDYFSIEYRHPKVKGKLAHLALYPGAANLVLGSAQRSFADDLNSIISANPIDVCIFMSRDLLFALPAIGSTTTIVDWVDSYFLYHLREARLHVKRARLSKLLRSMQLAAEAWIHERYYSRQADLSLAVSPVDQRYISREPNSQVVANGVASLRAVSVAKTKGQLIFTGNMDFPPNYQSALWFIDEVFPLLQQRADIRLVIAGANPVPELTARANERIQVTGYVEDLALQIAQSELYVAPLVCGSGFKNKVVEAVANGTYVIGTTMAVEFLDSEIRRRLLVADSPRTMADAILTYLDSPKAFETNLEEVRRLVAEELTWEAQASELLRLATLCTRDIE